jgi:hypothetical protein
MGCDNVGSKHAESPEIHKLIFQDMARFQKQNAKAAQQFL